MLRDARYPCRQSERTGIIMSDTAPTAGDNAYTNPYGAPFEPAAGATNTLAVLAFVLGLTVPPGGIIAGHMALARIRATGEPGRGLALAGLIIGYVLTVFWILAIIAWVAFLIFAIGSAPAGVTQQWELPQQWYFPTR